MSVMIQFMKSIRFLKPFVHVLTFTKNHLVKLEANMLIHFIERVLNIFHRYAVIG